MGYRRRIALCLLPFGLACGDERFSELAGEPETSLSETVNLQEYDAGSLLKHCKEVQAVQRRKKSLSFLSSNGERIPGSCDGVDFDAGVAEEVFIISRWDEPPNKAITCDEAQQFGGVSSDEDHETNDESTAPNYATVDLRDDIRYSAVSEDDRKSEKEYHEKILRKYQPIYEAWKLAKHTGLSFLNIKTSSTEDNAILNFLLETTSDALDLQYLLLPDEIVLANDHIARILSNFPRLKHFRYCSFATCNDNTANVIAKLGHNLTIIEVAGTGLTDDGIIALINRDGPSLSKLEIEGNFGERAITAFAHSRHATSIVSLKVVAYKRIYGFFDILASNENDGAWNHLKSIVLSSKSVPKLSPDSLSKLPVEDFTLTNQQLSQKQVLTLWQSLSVLRELRDKTGTRQQCWRPYPAEQRIEKSKRGRR